MQQPTGSLSLAGDACLCSHHKVVPGVVTLIGLTFLLNALGVISAYTTSLLWPVMLIGIGVMKTASRSCKFCPLP